jgi:hypothetical protein
MCCTCLHHEAASKILGRTVISAKVLAIAFILRMDCGRTIRFNDADQ